MFGNGLTHTIFSSTGSEFFSLPIFHEAIQVRNGIESGYYSASQPGNFIPAFIVPAAVMVSTDRAVNICSSGCLPSNDVSTAVLVYILGAVILPSQDMFPFA